jgi:hypothetical protein
MTDSNKLNVSTKLHSTQAVQGECRRKHSDGEILKIPSELLEAIPKEDSFESYIPYCKVAIKFGAKYRKLKRWFESNVVKNLDDMFEYENTAPIAKEEPVFRLPKKEKKQETVPTEKQNVLQAKKKLRSAYLEILNKTLEKYSFYGLLAHRASRSRYASSSLNSWTRIRISDPGLEVLHNKLIAKIAALPPSVISSLLNPQIKNEWSSKESYDQLSSVIQATSKHLDSLLEKYISQSDFAKVTDDDIRERDRIHNLLKRSYSGGLYTLDEVLQIPAHKLTSLNYEATKYEIISEVVVLLEQHIDESEKTFSEILGTNIN